jgi:hypothetical protein
MESPVPALIGLLLAGGLVYQVGFRYDQWVGGPHHNIVFERDHLTGLVREIHPGEHVQFMDRLLGKLPQRKHQDDSVSIASDIAMDADAGDAGLGAPSSEKKAAESGFLFAGVASPVTRSSADSVQRLQPSEPLEASQQAAAQNGKAPVPQPSQQQAVVNNGAAPTPPGLGQSLSQWAQTASLRSAQLFEDLNRDGQREQILRTPWAPDGLMDISVVTPNGRELFYGRGKALYVLPTAQAGWSDLALEVGRTERVIFRYNPKASGYEVVGAG